jgi:cellobiose transport system permease protein
MVVIRRDSTDGRTGPAVALRKRFRHGVRNYWAPYLFISPFYILFAIFGLFPPLFGFYISFQEWNGITPPAFSGMSNYVVVLTDKLFWQAFLNTVVMAVLATVPGLFLSLWCAFLLNNSIRRFRHFYLASLFSPTVASSAAIALIFGLIYGREFGILNASLRLAGLPAIDWLGNPIAMKVSLAVLLIWRWLGYNTVIYLAGLQAIPHEYYEAARVDGANTWHLFRHISVPLLRRVILFTTVLSTIGILQLFAEPYLLVGPGGGPGNSLRTMMMYLYTNAFTYFRFGYASAISYVLFVIVVVGTIVNLIVGRRREAI